MGVNCENKNPNLVPYSYRDTRITNCLKPNVFCSETGSGSTLQVYVTFTNDRDCRVKWRCLAQNKVKLAAASSQLYATRHLHNSFWNASSSG
ncbi:hypothetical protein JTE90_004979 [Oedothorax gibbosus]|uniref:Uncharacterized protein n=1 Tax=Oedothorax gibbosus TaxID=931172 RepID=A0AAV6VGA3_9ARAC|nr:hypothetical protein JTE90_004979 [Oedothorax gibbosus]